MLNIPFGEGAEMFSYVSPSCPQLTQALCLDLVIAEEVKALRLRLGRCHCLSGSRLGAKETLHIGGYSCLVGYRR